jgi:hypothetical protein
MQQFYLSMRQISNLAALFSTSVALSIAYFRFRSMQPLTWAFLAVVLVALLIAWHLYKDDAIGLIVLLFALVAAGLAVGAALW